MRHPKTLKRRVERLQRSLLILSHAPRQTQAPSVESQQTLVSHPDRDPAFDELLAYLGQSYGFSFTDYKTASLMRRIRRRMQQVSIETYCDYKAHLQANPDEFEPLFKTIEVNITNFFRNPPAWEYLATEIIPLILRLKSVDESVRVWSAGCASGEEPYSLAIVLAEALGMDEYQKRVRIFASDIDAESLHQARKGHYSALKMADVPVALQTRYFEQVGNDYSVRSELRSPLLFFRHNLLEEAPMSNIDLILCRNTLIYFSWVGQTKALVRFYFGLNHTGVLFLGSSEMLALRNRLFNPLSIEHHVLSKAEKSNLTRNLLIQGLKRS